MVSRQVAGSVILAQEDRFRYLKDYDPSKHFLLKYDGGQQKWHPGGYSGAGVWYHQEPGVVWQALSFLAGMETSFYSNRQLLRCVRVETIVRFLVELFGELGPDGTSG